MPKMPNHEQTHTRTQKTPLRTCTHTHTHRHTHIQHTTYISALTGTHKKKKHTHRNTLAQTCFFLCHCAWLWCLRPNHAYKLISKGLKSAPVLQCTIQQCISLALEVPQTIYYTWIATHKKKLIHDSSGMFWLIWKVSFKVSVHFLKLRSPSATLLHIKSR